MFKTFFHGSLRKYVVAFGTLFNNIHINRINSSGDTIQTLKIPLSYGPKEKVLSRIDNDPNLDRPAIVLPRMAFEIDSLEYDPTRKLNTLNRNYKVDSTSSTSNKTQYQSVPYNLGFTLDIMAKTADDATRIVEQIIPYFTPQWTVTLNLIPEIGLKVDVPIILQTTSMQDTYEGDYNSRRAIIWSLGFGMKAQFFKPVSDSAIINTTTLNYYIPTTATAVEGVNNTSISERTTITPGLTADGNPTTDPANTVPVADISADDNYGFILDFDTIEGAPYE